MAVRVRGLDPVLRYRAAEGRVHEILFAGSVAVRLAPLEQTGHRGLVERYQPPSTPK